MDFSPLVISSPLIPLYGVLILWINLFWRSISGSIFRLNFVEWTLFQRWVITPLSIGLFLGVCTTHVLILSGRQVTLLPISYWLPALITIGLSLVATLVFLVRVILVYFAYKRFDTTCQDALVQLRDRQDWQRTNRVETSLNSFFGRSRVNPSAAQRGFILSGITSKPWHKVTDFPWSQHVETAWQEIRSELLSLLKQNDRKRDLVKTYFYPGVNTGNWNSVLLIEGGKLEQPACALCPKTLAVLKQIPGYPNFREVLFSIINPGARIKPHRDYGNLYLTFQLGLIIPQGCSIMVGGEERTWTEGKSFIFDTSYEHSVINDSKNMRAVLIVDFINPEIEDFEKGALLNLGII